MNNSVILAQEKKKIVMGYGTTPFINNKKVNGKWRP